MCPTKLEGRTYYEVLGVPMGASINHVKDSYRLLTKKNPVTDAAYEVLTDPQKRREYNSQLMQKLPPISHVQSLPVGRYERVGADAAAANRRLALDSLKANGFRDCTNEVENAIDWAAFLKANGSGTERYFFSESGEYLLMIDFSPFVPSGDGWHTLGWWLYKDNGHQWEPIRDGELGDYSLPLALHALGFTH